MSKQIEPGTERAPRGTFSGAALVSPYFRIEHLKHNLERGKWRIPFSTKTARRLRKRIEEARRKLGIEYIADAVVPRPGAGQPLVGPIGLTQRVNGPSPITADPCPCCPGVRAPRQGFQVPSDQIIVPGLTYWFRSGLTSREPDREPLFQCIGLEV